MDEREMMMVSASAAKRAREENGTVREVEIEGGEMRLDIDRFIARVVELEGQTRMAGDDVGNGREISPPTADEIEGTPSDDGKKSRPPGSSSATTSRTKSFGSSEDGTVTSSPESKKISRKQKDLQNHKQAVWTVEEDLRMLAAFHQVGSAWKNIAGELGTGRTPTSVKNRYRSISRAFKREWTPEEDALLAALHSEFGNNWDIISQNMVNRTKNAVQVRTKYLKKKAGALENSVDEQEPNFNDSEVLEVGSPFQALQFLRGAGQLSSNQQTMDKLIAASSLNILQNKDTKERDMAQVAIVTLAKTTKAQLPVKESVGAPPTSNADQEMHLSSNKPGP